MTDQELQKNRLLAMAIDIGICVAISLILFMFSILFLFILRKFTYGTTISIANSVIHFVIFVIVGGYILGRDTFFNGNSVGKHLMKIKPVNSSGEGQILLIQSIKRNLIFIPPIILFLLQALVNAFVEVWSSVEPISGIFASLFSCLTGFFLYFLINLTAIAAFILELVLIIQKPDGIRWGDKFAGTMVVRQ